MEITLIGTGNVATSLYPALTGAGHEVHQLQGRTFTPQEVRGDVVIVCVKDNALPTVLSSIADTRALVLHTAGSVALDAIPARRRGVLYPMQSFSKARIIDFAEVSVFIESDTDMELLEQLAGSISRHVYQLNSEARRHLHLAAVFACNFVNHCYSLADDILQKNDIPFEVLLPLIDETARKVHYIPPHEAQTGPAVRYDTNVISRHETMLNGNAKDIYHLMSKSIYSSTI